MNKTKIVAVNTFVNTDREGNKVSPADPNRVNQQEFLEFWKSCTDAQKTEYAREAARELGIGLID